MFTNYEPGTLVPTNFQNGISVSGYQGFSNVSMHATSITLTPAQIFAFRDTQATNVKFIKSIPLENQGTDGNAIIPVSFVIQRLTGGATAYTNPQSFYIKYAGGNGEDYRIAAIPKVIMEEILTATVPTVQAGSFAPVMVDADVGQSYESPITIAKNADLEINLRYVQDSPIAAGDAPIKITLIYYVVSL